MIFIPCAIQNGQNGYNIFG